MLEHTAMGQLVMQYGYLAVLLGTMLEGETIVLAAGFLAHQGYLSVPGIIFCAVLGSVLSDQGIFFLARLRGKRLLARFPRLEAKVTAFADRMKARPLRLTLFALVFRFFYGLRNIAPVFLGMSGLSARRFVCLNLLGAVVWATLFSWGGYYLARALSVFLGTLARYELPLLLLLLAAGCGLRLYLRRRAARASGGSTP
ncbi:MAG: DedA family protein [Desulfovibrio sp.]|jgi:membrane protein DedA with SNARE-associated domain|nr:DedA family protein [Desulfovibrio sp.]